MPEYEYFVDTTKVMNKYRLPPVQISGKVCGLNDIDALVNALKQDRQLSHYIFYKWRTDFEIILHRIILDDVKIGCPNRAPSEDVVSNFFSWIFEQDPELEDLEEGSEKYLPYLEDIKLMSEASDSKRPGKRLFSNGDIRLLKRYMADHDKFEPLAHAIWADPEALFDSLQTFEYEIISRLAEIEMYEEDCISIKNISTLELGPM